MNKLLSAILILCALVAARADTTTERYDYRLQRGTHYWSFGIPPSPWGYVVYITQINSKGAVYRQSQVNVDDRLAVTPNDKSLQAMRGRAVTAIERCVRWHTEFHTIKADKGSNRPVAYFVNCPSVKWRMGVPTKAGCGNSYSTCDGSGKTLPEPCPAQP